MRRDFAASRLGDGVKGDPTVSESVPRDIKGLRHPIRVGQGNPGPSVGLGLIAHSSASSLFVHSGSLHYINSIDLVDILTA